MNNDMKYLNYTDEMRQQDKLWETEEEDLDKMIELYKQIMNEAVNKGFKGKYELYICRNEAIATVWENSERIIEEEVESFGFCRPLISHLEWELNR